MFPWQGRSKVIYILSNLLVIPAIVIPNIDFIANLSYIFSFVMLIKENVLFLLVLTLSFIFKNNSNYRFNLLLKLKGDQVAKSDYECVNLYAWCTLLRYFLIGVAANQMYLFFI